MPRRRRHGEVGTSQSFPAHAYDGERNLDHREQQTGLWLYSWARKRGEVQEIDKMPGKLQERRRRCEKLEAFASLDCFCLVFAPVIFRLMVKSPHVRHVVFCVAVCFCL